MWEKLGVGGVKIWFENESRTQRLEAANVRGPTGESRLRLARSSRDVCHLCPVLHDSENPWEALTDQYSGDPNISGRVVVRNVK